MRRLIMLISGGWLPPTCVRRAPSSIFRTSVCIRLLTKTRVTPKPGPRLFPWPEVLWVGEGLMGWSGT